MRLTADTMSVRLNGRAVLDGLSFQLCPGDILGIIGPNGAGKSTVLRALAGLVALTDGDVRLDGVALRDIPLDRRARLVAYLPQDMPPDCGLSVREIVALGRLPHRGNAVSARRAEDPFVAQAMCDVGLSAYADRPMDQLSGGEKSRGFLARALAVGAPVLLADEPVAALDPAQALSIMSLLVREAREKKGAIALVLHDMTLAARFCTKLLLLDKGRLVAEGAPKDVLTPEHFARVYKVSVRYCGDVPVPWERL